MVHVHPHATVDMAIAILREFGVSQLPVINAEPPVKAGEVVGSVTDRQLLDLVYRHTSTRGDRISDHLAPPLRWIGSGEDVDAARSALRTSDALMVLQDGEPIGIITSHDLLADLAR